MSTITYSVTLDTGSAMYTVPLESDYELQEDEIKAFAEELLMEGLEQGGAERVEEIVSNCKMVEYTKSCEQETVS